MPTTDPASQWPNYTEADYVIRNYRFASGEVLPELRLHYRTMGVPRRNAAGKIVNGVLLLQGNTGTGANWLRPSLADELYGPGQPLDATKYFFIMQDAIGRGAKERESAPELVRFVSMPDAPEAYGRALYAAFYDMDEAKVDVIVVERPPASDAWWAIADRLARAAR